MRMLRARSIFIHYWIYGGILLSSIITTVTICKVMINGIPNSFFFADDFLMLDKYQKLSQLLDIKTSAGRPITNLFFYALQMIFGTKSNSPYLLLSVVLLFSGFVIFQKSLINFGFCPGYSIPIVVSILIISGATLPIIFWASNVTHSAGFLFFSLSLFFSSKRIERKGKVYSLLSSLSAFFVSLCNPLFMPIYLISLVLLYMEYRPKKIQNYFFDFDFIINAILRIFLPVLYIFEISRPMISTNKAYRNPSLRFVIDNLSFYANLNFSASLSVFVILCLIIVLGLIFSWKNQMLLHSSFIISGFAILMGVLIQQNQRSFHYLIFPICLLMPAFLDIMSRSIKNYISLRVFTLVMSILVLLLTPFTSPKLSSEDHYFSSTPWGSNLKSLFVDSINLPLRNRHLCVKSEGMSSSEVGSLVAQISGSNFFTQPAIGASEVKFDWIEPCRDKGNYLVSIQESNNGVFRIFTVQ